MDHPPTSVTAKGAGLVLGVLAASQFLMTLDSSVMNVSITQVADDLGTPVTGIQTAITLYMLVMATLMITGGKVGTILGRRRAFGIGLAIYGCGSLITGLAQNLTTLIIGWSFLEGIGAALIMPAVVALVASNFPPERRTATYGLIAAAGAMAIAAGPLIGGAVTTLATWRYVFFGEVVVVFVILLFLRKVQDATPSKASLDLVGSLLSVVSLGLVVLGVLKSGEWGWVSPKPHAPELLGASPVIWMILGGFGLLYCFFAWQQRRVAHDQEPLLAPDLLRNPQLVGGLAMFFAQFLVQAGIFFTLPMFLSVVLELSAFQTGLRVFPLSIALLVTAAGIPKLWPRASPRRVVRVGVLLLVGGTLVIVGGMHPGADAGVVAIPMVLIGCGLGALSSQLGGVTVSAAPDSRAAEVGGVQNTVTNLGAALGTALLGSVLISALTSSVLTGLENSPDVPQSVVAASTTELSAGVPFLSDTQLTAGLEKAGITGKEQDAIVAVNDAARFEALRKAFAAAALLGLLSLFLTGRIPDEPAGEAPSSPRTEDDEPALERDDA